MEQDNYLEEREYISKKYREVTKRGVVLLDKMNKEKREVIHQIIKEYKDVASYDIGDVEPKQVALRYRPYVKGMVHFKKLKDEGTAAYKNGDYDECINKYLPLLYFREPRAFVYAHIGLAYLKKGKKKIAMDYLTIATSISKLEGSRLDYTDLVRSIKTSMDERNIAMREEDFLQGVVESNYQKLDFRKIIDYLNKNNLDIESTISKLELNEEEGSIVILLCAYQYFLQNDTNKGNEFLKVYEKSGFKTDNTKRMYQEIIKNRKIYPAKNEDKTYRLALTIKTKKSNKD